METIVYFMRHVCTWHDSDS